MKKIDGSTLKEVQHIEMCLGGNHDKGWCIFMAAVLIRHKNEFKEPHIFELKLGEINEDTDGLEHIEEMIKEISCPLVDMKMSNEWNAVMLLYELRNTSYATTTSTDALTSGNYLIKFCIIGDAKGALQLAGRSGFDYSYCVFCKCRPKEWKTECIIRSGENSDEWVQKKEVNI